MKGMLTGPVTVLNWSFPRKDISRKAQAFQLAAALRQEVAALEAAGCRVVQVRIEGGARAPGKVVTSLNRLSRWTSPPCVRVCLSRSPATPPTCAGLSTPSDAPPLWPPPRHRCDEGRGLLAGPRKRYICPSMLLSRGLELHWAQ